MRHPWTWLIAALVLAVGAPYTAAAQDEEPERASMEGHVFRPAKRDATPDRIAGIRVPDGFSISVFAKDLNNTRMLAVRDDGSVYVTRRDQGDVLMLRDTTGDGVANEIKTATQLKDAHGIALRGDRAYVVTIQEIYEADIQEDGTFGEPRRVVEGIPTGGQHPNRTIDFGPDGMLYLTVGSTCNSCNETDPENATMVIVDPDTWSREVFAPGLRNTVGFGWHPETRELWGMDHNTDWMGDDRPEEELNRIERGAHYGWPWVFGNGDINRSQPLPAELEHTTKEEIAKRVRRQVLGYTAHAAPMQMAFYTGTQFPEEYRNDAFVAMRGSWNRSRPVGYEVVRIRFDGGEPQAIETFASGWLVEDGNAHFGRLAGCAVDRDGSLLIADDSNGVIYRIAYDR